MNILHTIFTYLIAIPLWLIISMILGFGIKLTTQYLFEKVGPNWPKQIAGIKKNEQLIKKEKDNLKHEKEDIDQIKKVLLLKKEKMQKTKKELEQRNEIVKFKQSEWQLQDKEIQPEYQYLAFERMIRDINGSYLKSDFLKNLKRYIGSCKNGTDVTDSYMSSPVIVDKVRQLLAITFQDSGYYEYVLSSFGMSIENGVNPVLASWELFRIYGKI